MANQYTVISNQVLEDKDLIISLFLNGTSLTKMETITGYSRKTLSKYLDIWGIRKTSSLGCSIEQRTKKSYKFKSWDKNTAYWLGFLFADGSIYYSKRGYFRFELGLAAIDLEHLNNFCKFITLDKQPVFRPKTNSYRICFGDSEFCADLIQKGIVPGKSNFEAPLPNIPEELISDFMLGLLDGDGSIGINNNRIVISLTGNRFSCALLKSILKKGSIFRDPRHRPHVKTFSTVLSKRDLPLLEEWYKNPNQLKRKKILIEKAIHILNSRKCRVGKKFPI